MGKYNEKKRIYLIIGKIQDEIFQDKDWIDIKANIVLKDKRLKRYLKIGLVNKFKIFDRDKDNYSSRKEIRNQWSERIYAKKLNKMFNLIINVFWKEKKNIIIIMNYYLLIENIKNFKIQNPYNIRK